VAGAEAKFLGGQLAEAQVSAKNARAVTQTQAEQHRVALAGVTSALEEARRGALEAHKNEREAVEVGRCRTRVESAYAISA